MSTETTPKPTADTPVDLTACPYYRHIGTCAHFPGVSCVSGPECIQALTEAEFAAWREGLDEMESTDAS